MFPWFSSGIIGTKEKEKPWLLLLRLSVDRVADNLHTSPCQRLQWMEVAELTPFQVRMGTFDEFVDALDGVEVTLFVFGDLQE